MVGAFSVIQRIVSRALQFVFPAFNSYRYIGTNINYDLTILIKSCVITGIDDLHLPVRSVQASLRAIRTGWLGHNAVGGLRRFSRRFRNCHRFAIFMARTISQGPIRNCARARCLGDGLVAGGDASMLVWKKWDASRSALADS